MRKNSYYKYRNRTSIKFKVWILIIGIIIILFTIMLFPHFLRNTYEVTIINKQIVNREGRDKFLIYTRMYDGKIKIFENTNSFVEFKFNSEDIYGALAIYGRYEITAYGLDIPWLLCYQNIIEIKGI